MLEPFSKWYDDHKERLLADFFTLLKFPSISTLAENKTDVQNTAEWLKNYLTAYGLDVKLIASCNHPVLFAQKIVSKEAPTLLFYGHYDVQPVDPLDLWRTPPFEPTVIEESVYARGALDNKGQMFYTTLAIAAFLQLYPDAPLNIKVILEGEEESGGQGTEEVLSKYASLFKADELYIVDFDIDAVDKPSITLGTRGILASELSIKTADIDLHSGMHGGIALNANHLMVKILSSFWDDKGHITIDGFYDDMELPSTTDKNTIDFAFDTEEYQKQFGVKAFAMEPHLSALESNWLYPCLEVNGLYGGYTSEGFKTVIPKEAHAKISCRLVPNQDPADIAQKIEKHIAKQVPLNVEMNYQVHHLAKAFRTPFQASPVQKACSALEAVFEAPCHYVLCGASVPIVPLLQAVSGAQTCLLGVGLSSDSIHAPNEHFGLSRLYKGFLIIAQILYKSAYNP